MEITDTIFIRRNQEASEEIAAVIKPTLTDMH
jgi:hypothetical protein